AGATAPTAKRVGERVEGLVDERQDARPMRSEQLLDDLAVPTSASFERLEASPSRTETRPDGRLQNSRVDRLRTARFSRTNVVHHWIDDVRVDADDRARYGDERSAPRNRVASRKSRRVSTLLVWTSV